MKILLVEDDPKILSFVSKGLKEQGFVVDSCDNGNEGYDLALGQAYDLMILDIMLPGRDGLSILRELRDKKITVPVILLTARSAIHLTYASEFFSWYSGSVEADTYFCPERHGTYFGGFYMKDMPAMGKRDYVDIGDVLPLLFRECIEKIPPAVAGH